MSTPYRLLLSVYVEGSKGRDKLENLLFDAVWCAVPRRSELHAYYHYEMRVLSLSDITSNVHRNIKSTLLKYVFT